jgi:hypothetical protein
MGCCGERHVTGITALLAGVSASPVGTVSLSNQNAFDTEFEGSTASAAYVLNANGSFVSTGEAGGFWITPQEGMGSFEVRATLNSGSLTSGTTGVWLALNANRSWLVEQFSVGDTSANLTMQIRRIGDSSILASATVSVTAEITSL